MYGYEVLIMCHRSFVYKCLPYTNGGRSSKKLLNEIIRFVFDSNCGTKNVKLRLRPIKKKNVKLYLNFLVRSSCFILYTLSIL